MITYVYRHTDKNYECPNGYQFEVQQSMKDPHLRVCDKCYRDIERVIQISQFKDSFWDKKADPFDGGF